MKILVVCQHYYPEPFRVTRIAEELQNRGHEVSVLTGIPNYPEGEYYSGYSKKEKREETLHGIHVIRAAEHPRKKGVLHRVWNYYSYSRSGQKMAKKLPGDFDIVFTVGLSPVMMANPAIAYKKKYGAPILMYEMDLWPESLLAGGIQKNGVVYRHYQKVSSRIYSQMDEILVTSKPHIDYLSRLVGKQTRLGWLPQFADDPYEWDGVPKPVQAETTLLFAGNIGKAQACIALLQAAEILQKEGRSDIRFLFVGSGSELDSLKQFQKEHHLENVTFVGRVPLKEVGSYYEKADAAIVSLSKASYCRYTVPGKVQSYLKAGLPILSLDSGATSEWIKEMGCGLTCSAEDPKAFARLALEFGSFSQEKRQAMAEAGHAYYQTHLQEKDYMDALESYLVALSTRKSNKVDQ